MALTEYMKWSSHVRSVFDYSTSYSRMFPSISMRIHSLALNTLADENHLISLINIRIDILQSFISQSNVMWNKIGQKFPPFLFEVEAPR